MQNGICNVVLSLCVAGTCLSAEPYQGTATATTKVVDYVIVVTGAELLAGAYPDGHTHFLTRTLHPLGYHCVGSLTVDDRREDIRDAMKYAQSLAPLVIVTGGLGPTDNDITRQTLAEYTGIPVREQPEVIAAMENRFHVDRDHLRGNLRRQAMVPARGTFLKSAQGTAVGLIFELPEQVIVALPGPPRELQPMVRDELVPYLSRHFGTRMPGCAITIRFVGLGQSQIDETMDEKVPMPDGVIVTSQFDGGGRVDFGFQLPEDTSENRSRLEELKKKIVDQFRDNIYADNATTTLEDCVADRLCARNECIALAEVGSGGSLSASLCASAAAPKIRPKAFIAASNDELSRLVRVPAGDWNRDATGQERLILLARHLSQVTDCRCTVVVGEVEQRDGAALLTVVVKTSPASVSVRKLPASSGDPMRARLVTSILDQLRRQLQ